MTEKIGDAWYRRCKSRPTIDFSKRVCPQRPALALIVVRKEFRSVGSNIDIRRALGLARFAGETQIERFFDVLVFPAVAKDFALQQFKEKVRTPTRTVFLLSRGHITWAHGSAVALSARSKPDAAQRGVCERAAIVGKLEMCLRFQRAIVRAEPQIFRW